MQDAVYLSKPDDPSAVVKAFQEALDIVLNAVVIDQLINARFNHQKYQHVYHDPAGNAVGCVSIMFTGGNRQNGSLFVDVNQPSGRAPSMIYVPLSIVQRLRVSVKGTRLEVPLADDGQIYRAHLRAPSQTLQAHPHGLIKAIK